MDNGILGLIIVASIVCVIVYAIYPSTTFKCRKCGFTTSDPLRAAGHVATENKHACDEI
jgi:hypothetical protein